MVKFFIGSLILLFCMPNLQAQYTVYNVKGTVEVSIDGETWVLLKKKDELKKSYQIRLLENSLVEIIDSKNFIYSYASPKIVSVNDILKKRESVWGTLNEKLSKKRSAVGVVDRGGVKIDTIKSTNEQKNARLRFKEKESGWYDYAYWDLMPTGSVFYITILNETGEDKTVNVYQELENGEQIPCFPEDIWIEKNTSIEITELLFGKQETNTFVVVEK